MLPLPRLRRTVVVLAFAVAAATLGLSASSSVAQSANPITPGNFTGYGFDQCEAPSQSTMTTWLKSSPFRAAGIYISGALRYCQAQTNLTPTWVATQLATGWRLLPIHLGAQASCSTRARYQSDLINPDPTDDYAAARAQGRTEANIAAAAATNLGIAPESSIYYDMEAFDISKPGCRISTLKFLSAWSNRITANGFTSGVYSSAASGIKALDDARVTPGNTITMPYQIWIADWNGKADTSSTYIRPDGWPGRRIHQYQGGHDETWGGVKVNIDRDYLALSGGPYTPAGPATPEQAAKMTDPKCTTTSIDHTAYRYTDPRTRPGMYVALQCLLKQRGLYAAMVTGNWNPRTTAGVEAWQKRVGHRVQRGFSQNDWVSIVVADNTGTVLKPGVRGPDVIRAQRALNAAGSPKLTINGIYDTATANAVGLYQSSVGISPTKVVATLTWRAFRVGRR